VPRIGRPGEPPPAVLDALFESQRVEGEGESVARGAERARKTCGRRAPALRDRVGETVQRLRQRQPLALAADAQGGQRIVVDARPVGDRGRAVRQQPLEILRKLVRAREPQPPEPRAPARRRGTGGQRRLDLGVIEAVELQREEERGRGDLRRARSDVGLEPTPVRIVARRRDRERRIGADDPELHRGRLIEAECAGDQLSKLGRL